MSGIERHSIFSRARYLAQTLTLWPVSLSSGTGCGFSPTANLVTTGWISIKNVLTRCPNGSAISRSLAMLKSFRKKRLLYVIKRNGKVSLRMKLSEICVPLSELPSTFSSHTGFEIAQRQAKKRKKAYQRSRQRMPLKRPGILLRSLSIRPAITSRSNQVLLLPHLQFQFRNQKCSHSIQLRQRCLRVSGLCQRREHLTDYLGRWINLHRRIHQMMLHVWWEGFQNQRHQQKSASLIYLSPSARN